MPRQALRKQFLNFVGGLNTEASPLSFPENAAKDLDNVDLQRDGSIRRRRGLDFETNGAFGNVSYTLSGVSSAQQVAVTTHEWKSVGGDDNLNILVVQVGRQLFFHNLGADPISPEVMGVMTLQNLRTDPSYANYPISGTSGKGRFFVVGKAVSPFYIEYDADNQEFLVYKITLKIRDMDGIDEDTQESPIQTGDGITPGTPIDPSDDYDDVIPDLGTIDIGNIGEIFYPGSGPGYNP